MLVHVFMFPETSGKTLEEVERIFTDTRGSKDVGTPAWKTRVQYHRAAKMEQTGSLEDEEKLAHNGLENQSGPKAS